MWLLVKVMANYTLLIKLDFWETVHHISNNTCPSSCLIPVLGTKLLTIKFYTFVSDSYYLVDKNLCILNYNSSAKYLYLNLKIHFSSKQRSCYVVGKNFELCVNLQLYHHMTFDRLTKMATLVHLLAWATIF